MSVWKSGIAAARDSTSLRGRYPPYFVFGPLVFSKVSTEFLSGFDRMGERFFTAFSLIGSTYGATVNETVAGSNIIGQDPWKFDLITGLAIVAAMAANVQIARLRNLGKLQ